MTSGTIPKTPNKLSIQLAKLFRIAVLFFTLAWPVVWAQPLDLITEKAWLEDPTGQMSLDLVQQSRLQPLAGKEFNQGYSASAFWLRIRIDPTLLAGGHATERLVMRIRSPNLDDVRLFDPLHSGAEPQISGDRHPQQGQAYRSLNLNFLLPPGPSPRDVWLRISTTSSTLTKLQVVAESEVRILDMHQALWSMGYIAILLVCLGWAAVAWQLLRDPLIVFYIFREIAAIAFSIAVFGGFLLVDFDGLPPYWVDLATNFIACSLSVMFILFDIKLLSQFKPHPLGLWLLRTGASLCAFAALLTLVGYVPLGFQINSWVVVFIPLLLIFTVLSTRAWTEGQAETKPSIPRWSLLALYMIFPALIILNRAVLLGWIPPVVVASHVLLAYMLVGSVAMMIFLQLRASGYHKQHQETQMRLRLTQQMAHDERNRRQEQERFLAMLGHELRNPLAAVGMLADQRTEDGKQIKRAVSEMAQVLERSLQSSRLADGRLEPVIEEVDLYQLLQETCQRSDRIELGNFEPSTHVRTDRVCLQIVLNNLVDNALKYSPPDSPVKVDCSMRAEGECSSLRIKVINQVGAAGLPDANNVFQKYYRSPKSHHRVGSGLGLYLTKSVTEMLKGRIEYVPHPERQPPLVEFVMDLPQPFDVT